ncbi:hypothetical protein R5R35_006089 [Gryllus longicercus]|uniref:Uncharacterized protein n=1 Tax=Gryllus longicercus TaxID=2509291 RepID=A0AAN9W028_9ORTH
MDEWKRRRGLGMSEKLGVDRGEGQAWEERRHVTCWQCCRRISPSVQLVLQPHSRWTFAGNHAAVTYTGIRKRDTGNLF